MPRSKPQDAALGKAVRRARTAVGLSQAALAERIDVAVETVSRIERGTIAPSIAVVLRIADVLDVGLDELLRGRTTPKTQRRDSPELRRVTSLLHGLDDEALGLVHRGLQAFLRLRRPGAPRRKPTAR